MTYPNPVFDNVVFSNTTNLAINSLTITITDGTATVLTINANTFSMASNSTGTNTTLLVNSAIFFVGNSTLNSYCTSTTDVFNSNSTANLTLNTTSIIFNDNSTASFVVNGTGAYHTGTMNAGSYTVGAVATVNSTVINAGTNTMLHSGTSSIAANGYSWLTNGLLLQWGLANANLVTNTVTFPVPFPIACFSVTTTASNLVATANVIVTYMVCVVNSNSSAFGVKSANATNTAFYWMATGH